MAKTKLLVVDDEWHMRNLLRFFLTRDGFEITEAKHGEEALAFLDQNDFDLIILDLMMPGMDGWEVCTEVRKKGQTPILMLTARTETKDKVRGLNLGADDYLVKPFEPEELVARVHALLRRHQLAEKGNEETQELVFPEMIINLSGRKVLVKNKELNLTPKEFDLLYFLSSRHNQVFTRDILLDQIWGDDYFGSFRTVDTHVKTIREKFRKMGLSYNPIRTIWGVGYQFQGSDERT